MFFLEVNVFIGILHFAVSWRLCGGGGGGSGNFSRSTISSSPVFLSSQLIVARQKDADFSFEVKSPTLGVFLAIKFTLLDTLHNSSQMTLLDTLHSSSQSSTIFLLNLAICCSLEYTYFRFSSRLHDSGGGAVVVVVVVV